MYPAFVDCPMVAEHFCKYGCYRVMLRDGLDAPISDDAIARLTSAERQQIKYWNPTMIVEIIFNAWD